MEYARKRTYEWCNHSAMVAYGVLTIGKNRVIILRAFRYAAKKLYLICLSSYSMFTLRSIFLSSSSNEPFLWCVF